METIAPASNLQIKPGTADGIVKVIKNVTNQTGQQRLLRQAVRMAEMSDDRLVTMTGKMSDKEKRNMAKALSSLGRVARAMVTAA